MNARKSMSFIGAAIVVAIAGAFHPADAGIDAGGKPKDGGSTVSKGRISGFGSVYVNGVRFNTDNALFLINGAPGAESDLHVGQIVTVTGWIDDASGEGTALLVKYQSAVDGPISAIDYAANRISVLGQSVLIDAETTFSGLAGESIASLSLNDDVSISGYTDSAGDIVATHVAAASEPGMELTGAIAGVDSTSSSFSINGLAVDYGAANLFDLPAGRPEAGLEVRVNGVAIDNDGQLVATSVSAVENDLAAASGAEIAGLVSAITSFTEFELSGTPVRIDGGTRFVNGWIFGLGADLRIEAEGSVDDDGVLLADRIVFRPSGDIRHSGFVQAIESDSIVLDGMRINLTPETSWEDDSAAELRRFNLGALRTGDFVEVRGYASPAGLTATRVEREDADDGEGSPFTFGTELD